MTSRAPLAVGDRVSVPSASGRSRVSGTVELVELADPDEPGSVDLVTWRDDWGALHTHTGAELSREGAELDERYRATSADNPEYPFESAVERAASRARRQARMRAEAERLSQDPEYLAEVRRIQEERREW